MRRIWGLAASVLLLTGCTVSIPSDPNGTLDRVVDGNLNVGVPPNGEWTVETSGAESGSEAELVEGFAETINADIEWTEGSEEELGRALERENLDLVVGGLTEDTPWLARVGVTGPYEEFKDEEGTTHRLVMQVRMGENAFLIELEKFLSRAQAGGR